MGWPRGAPRRRGAHAMAQMAQWLIRPWASHILRHAFTEYFFALVFIIVHTRSKMHLLGANNLLMYLNQINCWLLFGKHDCHTFCPAFHKWPSALGSCVEVLAMLWVQNMLFMNDNSHSHFL